MRVAGPSMKAARIYPGAKMPERAPIANALPRAFVGTYR